MMPSEWHDWHDFYMLLGTASAALVALLFVAVAIGIALVAVAGLGYTTVVLLGLARASISDIADRFGYGILPLASYAAVLAAAGVVVSRAMLAAGILAAALLILLAVNIRNAWDLMLAFARQIANKNTDT